MSDRDLDAKVAELIFGWEWVQNYLGSERLVIVPHDKAERYKDKYRRRPAPKERGRNVIVPDDLPPYTSDASADYLCLEFVRCEWPHEEGAKWERFIHELRSLQINRVRSFRGTPDDEYGMYVVGDYSRAALAVVDQLIKERDDA